MVAYLIITEKHIQFLQRSRSSVRQCSDGSLQLSGQVEASSVFETPSTVMDRLVPFLRHFHMFSSSSNMKTYVIHLVASQRFLVYKYGQVCVLK